MFYNKVIKIDVYPVIIQILIINSCQAVVKSIETSAVNQNNKSYFRLKYLKFLSQDFQF